MYICSCAEIPQNDSCSNVLAHTHYAPGTLAINVDPDDLDDEIRQINELPDFDNCAELINKLNCMITYPACSVNREQLIPLCPSQCPQLSVQIAQCSLDLLNVYNSDFQLVQKLLNSFECDDPQTYYNFPSQYIENNSTNCLMISAYISEY